VKTQCWEGFEEASWFIPLLSNGVKHKGTIPGGHLYNLCLNSQPP